jgi:superfamily II DNA or RNA helicase
MPTDPLPPATEPLLESLRFRYPFRKYQRMVLEQTETAVADGRYHIAAPPGSGKTILGIELIRVFAAPAVVFAPTTTIQMQWADKVGLFLSDGALREKIVSLDPRRLAPINIFTYQLISTPAAAHEHEREMATRRWIQELLEEQKAPDETAARSRVESLRRNNPAAYRKEIARTYGAVKRELLRGEGVDVAEFLHPHARKLVRDLAAHGVRTVVLDECHHLLDYWAIVLRHLISQLADPRIVGLTATLPAPESEPEYENYSALLGEVDFEVPAPAVIKEGDLAPYRDLVQFVSPSPREEKYLKEIQTEFEAAVGEITLTEAFAQWVATGRPSPSEEDISRWAEFVQAEPVFSLAVMRYWVSRGAAFPPGVDPPTEANQPMTIADWSTLLERYGLDVLKVSQDAQDHRRYQRLRKILLPFGMTITEKGIRQSRSAGDLILAFSESKDFAVVEILQAESRAMGDRLRAIVVTDFERMTSGVKTVRGVLDPDAGSAFRVYQHLVDFSGLDSLCPVLATGKTLCVASAHSEQLLQFFMSFLQSRNRKAECRLQKTASPRFFKVEGDGPDWGPRSYVPMVTAAFEKGVIRCIVGTRGIFGEGWDSISLNTLIDLTAVTTAPSVQQLRGRSLRKDPAWPRKLSHHWDVICVAAGFPKGFSDLRRFTERHQKYWGVRPPEIPPEPLEEWPITPHAGEIVRGVTHVSPELAGDLIHRELKSIPYSHYSRNMLRQVKFRDRSYDLWKVGAEYSNFSYSAARIPVMDLNLHTVYTLENTLEKMIRVFWGTMVMTILNVVARSLGLFKTNSLSSGWTVLSTCASVLIIATAAVLVLNLRSAWKLAREMLIRQPPDAILLDLGRALLSAMMQAKLIRGKLSADYLRAVIQPDGSYQVFLDYASPEDSDLFIRAYQEILGPIEDPRYLIRRDDSRLPSWLLTPVWRILRKYVRKAAGEPPEYYPMPKCLSRRREDAETFAQYWHRYVGGGQLIFTRSDEGRTVLYKTLAKKRPDAKGLAFEIWR